jgi:CHAD domain-containing protein
MTFRLAKNEPVNAGLRRVALEEIDAAIAYLMAGRGNATALHEARKALKRLRALLALGWPLLKGRALVLDGQLRNIGRQLALHREVDALGALLEAESHGAGCRGGGMLRAAVHLHHEAALPPGVLADRNRDLERARRVLRSLRRQLVHLPVDDTPASALRRRLRKAYRRARRTFRAARETRAPDALHRLRIRAKQLLNQARLVRAWGGPQLAVLQRDLSRLDNMLGRARDCDTLAHILRGVPLAETPLRDGFGLRARLEAVSAAQSASALRLGTSLFRRRSRGWVAQMFA